MLKKLQNLLFEEDEDDIEDEEEEEIVPIRPARPKKETPAPKPTPAPRPVQEVEVKPAVEEPKKTMQRIDLTAPIETAKPRPVQETPVSSLFADDTPVEPAPAPKPKKLGITVDDAPAKPVSKPVENRPLSRTAAKAAAAPVRPLQAKKEPVKNDGYVFKPVISPIFGVDEKDLHALKTTTSKITEAEKNRTAGTRPQIISPIYGADQDNSPSSIRETVQASDALESVIGNARNMAAEDTIPEFSLDDILKVRDEEVKNTPVMPAFPDLDFDDDDEDDKTILIKRSDSK
ncbi:MAG: hypothetical protein ACI32N_09885 [Bulleidia sp.]